MEDQLETLIACYEEEKKRLLQLIPDCLQDHEYELAHFHSKALYQLNRRMQTLHNIREKFFDEKSFHREWIARREKELKADPSAFTIEFLNEQLAWHREALDRLNGRSIVVSAGPNGSVLDESLQQLLNKKIKNFKLVLKKSAGFLLEFTYSTQTLKVSLPAVKQHCKTLLLGEDKLHAFERLGFYPSANNNRLFLTLTGNKDEIINTIKEILSKIVFEVFYFREFDNESYIDIGMKTTRK